MKAVHRWSAVAVLSLATAASAVAQVVVVEVRSAVGGAPIAGAVANPVGRPVTATTDRLGRARLSDIAPGDRIALRAVAFRPDTITAVQGAVLLEARLDPMPVSLADLSTTEWTGKDASWSVPRSVIQALPAAVEPDPFRALQVVPSVSFSSPLSARPLVRGYDASGLSIRMDGYEIQNPYHIGRMFSAFPGDAVETVRLTQGPADLAAGGALAGNIDAVGRQPDEGLDAGAEVTLASLTGWAGTNHNPRTLGAGRIATISGVSELVGSQVPYVFADGYLRSALPITKDRPLELTAFLSRDRLGNDVTPYAMQWSNVLLGSRFRLLEGARAKLDLTGSFNRFHVASRDLPSQGRLVDITNALDRANLELQGETAVGATVIQGGFSLGQRSGTSLVTPSTGAGTDRQGETSEVAAFLRFAGRLGAFTYSIGGRLDAASSSAFGPALSIARRFGAQSSLSLRAGRSTRTFQVITDQQAEPELVFFDLWLPADGDSVPVPRVDHASLEADHVAGRWSLFGALFASQGKDLGELVPVHEGRDASGVRYGDSRTAGVELRASLRAARPEGPNLALTYVVSQSDRRWEDGTWRRWLLDRRHLVRVQGDLPIGSRWRVGGVGEFMSGQPLTPVIRIVGVEGPLTPAGPSFFIPVYEYGEESSGTSAATVRFDLGIRGNFGGPGESRITVAASIINAGFGPVAPSVPANPFETAQSGGPLLPNGVEYKRLFTLPAVPSLLFRWEF